MPTYIPTTAVQATGTANALTIILSDIMSLASGTPTIVIAALANTAAATIRVILSVSSGTIIGPVAITKRGGFALTQGDIAGAGHRLILIYTGTGFELANPIDAGSSAAYTINAVDDFGADPTGTIDSTPMLQAAFNAAGLNINVYIPPGNYIVAAKLTYSAGNSTLRGAGKNAAKFIIPVGQPSIDVLEVTGGTVVVDGIGFFAAGTRTGGAYVIMTGSDITLTNFFMSGGYIGVKMVGGNGMVDHGTLSNFVPATGVGIWVESLGAQHKIGSFITMSQDVASPQPLAGLRITSTQDVSVGAAGFLRAGTGVLINPGNGQVVASPTFFGTQCDNCTVRGFDATPVGTGAVISLRAVALWASSTATNENIRIGARVFGADFIDTHCFLGAVGIAVVGGTDIHFNGGEIAQCVGAAMTVAAGVVHFSVIAMAIGAVNNFTANGSGIVVAVGASDFYILTLITFRGQASAVTDGGTGVNKIVANNLGT